jgi:hypothetical protein
METKRQKVVQIDQLALLPPVPIHTIARAERVSANGVASAARKLGIVIDTTPTGRKTVSPVEAVRIVQSLRGQS